MPMNGEAFVVIVALGEDKPDLSTLKPLSPMANKA